MNKIFKKIITFFSCLIIIISITSLTISCKDDKNPRFSTKIQYKPNFKTIDLIPGEIVSFAYVQIINPIPGEKIKSIVPDNDLIETGFDENEQFFIKGKKVGEITIFLTYKNAEDLWLEIEVKENVNNWELVNFNEFELQTNLGEIQLSNKDEYHDIHDKIVNKFIELNKIPTQINEGRSSSIFDINRRYKRGPGAGFEYNEKSYRYIFAHYNRFYLPEPEKNSKIYHGYSVKIEYTLLK